MHRFAKRANESYGYFLTCYSLKGGFDHLYCLDKKYNLFCKTYQKNQFVFSTKKSDFTIYFM